MKLVRFGEKGKERPGVWVGDGQILDVRASGFPVEDYNTHFFSDFGIQRLIALLGDSRSVFLSAANTRLGPPIARPGKIICVGANYAAHAAEFGAEVPYEPILFSKAVSALSGPYDPIVLPQEAEVVDSEVELAVVMGREAKCISASEALDYVAGYTLLNDVTERALQRRDGQWFRAKGFDTFCPLGPFLVTPDEIPCMENLALWNRLNNEPLQEGNSKDMVFSVAYLVAYISKCMTLLPGDVISTGTPAGIGSAHTPPRLMRAGDLVEIGIDGLGAQKTIVV